MAIKANLGNPFVGYVSLTNGAPGPVSIPISVARNGAGAYTLRSTERLVITNFTISTNDTALELVTITDGAPTPTKIYSGYVTSTFPPTIVQVANDILRGYAATNLVATASAVTSAKTIEIMVYGVITSSN